MQLCVSHVAQTVIGKFKPTVGLLLPAAWHTLGGGMHVDDVGRQVHGLQEAHRLAFQHPLYLCLMAIRPTAVFSLTRCVWRVQVYEYLVSQLGTLKTRDDLEALINELKVSVRQSF